MKRLVAIGLGCLCLALSSTAVQAQVKKGDIPQLIKDLAAADAKMRLTAAQGIGKVGQLKAVYAKDGIGPLCDTVVKDDDTKVRAAAATALGMILLEPAKVVPVLAMVVKDEKELPVQQAAITSLGYFGADAKDALPALNDAMTKAKKELADAADDKAKIKTAKAKIKVLQASLSSINGKK